MYVAFYPIHSIWYCWFVLCIMCYVHCISLVRFSCYHCWWTEICISNILLLCCKIFN